MRSFANHINFLSKTHTQNSHPSASHTVHVPVERSWQSKYVTDACHLVSSWRSSDSPMTNAAEEPTQRRNGSWILVLSFCCMALVLFNCAKWKVSASEINTQVFCLLRASFIPPILNCTTVTVLTQRVGLHALQSVLNDQGGTGIAGPNSQNCCQLLEIRNNRVPENRPVFVDFICFAYFRVIYECQNGCCIREGHSSRERGVFAGHL